MPKTLVSIGMSCQTAHQMARFADAFPQKAVFEKGPFDWLICPPRQAANWLQTGLEDFQVSEVTDDRGHAYWQRHELWFWHGFFTKYRVWRNLFSGGSKKSVLEIEQNCEAELSKLSHQRSKFRKLDPENTVFVVSNLQNNLENAVFNPKESHKFRFCPMVVEELKTALDTYFRASTRLIVVTREDRLCGDLENDPNVHLLSPDDSEWKGCDVQWNELLCSVT